VANGRFAGTGGAADHSLSGEARSGQRAVEPTPEFAAGRGLSGEARRQPGRESGLRLPGIAVGRRREKTVACRSLIAVLRAGAGERRAAEAASRMRKPCGKRVWRWVRRAFSLLRRNGRRSGLGDGAVTPVGRAFG